MTAIYTPAHIRSFTMFSERGDIPAVDFFVDNGPAPEDEHDRGTVTVRIGGDVLGQRVPIPDEVRVDGDYQLADMTRAIDILLAVRDELARLEATHG